MSGEDGVPVIQLKTEREIEPIARGGAIIADLFRQIEPMIRPEVTTWDLDRFADDFIRSHEGAVPAFKGLYGFPGSVCTSVNDEVVHGIPSRSRRAEGGGHPLHRRWGPAGRVVLRLGVDLPGGGGGRGGPGSSSG